MATRGGSVSRKSSWDSAMLIGVARLAASTVICLFIQMGAAHPYFVDGNKLLTFCGGTLASEDLGLCLGYIAGISDSDDVRKQAGIPGWQACVPSQATLRQLVDVTKKYLVDHRNVGTSVAPHLFPSQWSKRFPARDACGRCGVLFLVSTANRSVPALPYHYGCAPT